MVKFSLFVDKINTPEKWASNSSFAGEKHDAMILVQTESLPRDDRPILINGVKYDKLIQFHLVDLKGNDIQYDCVPPLVSLAIITTMVVLNGSIFIFGCLYDHVDKSGQSNQLESQSLESPLKFYLGSSRIKLKLDQSQGEGEVWGTVPRPDVGFPRCISFLGKIYIFRTKPMVLDDPTVGKWRELPLPSHLADFRISWAIPDPANHRILVHSSGVGFTRSLLYAFTPPDYCPADVHGSESAVGKWDLIDPHFRRVYKAFTLVDDVIYFHCDEIPSVIWAYDLNSRVWLDVSWSESFNDKADMNNAYIDYDELLHLGDKTFCLTASACFPGPFDQNATEIFFDIFKAKRRGSSLILDPVTIKSYVLPGTSRAKKFLAV